MMKLREGEIKVIAMVKLTLNCGRLKVVPGKVVILGPDDVAQGVNIGNLLKNGAVVIYKNEKQRKAIEKEWLTKRKAERESIRFAKT